MRERLPFKKIERSLEEKRHHYDQWKQSGLTKKDYCKANNIATTTFLAWVKRFEEKGPPENKKQINFLKIPVKQRLGLEIKKMIEVKLPNGIRCGFEGEWEACIQPIRNLYGVGH